VPQLNARIATRGALSSRIVQTLAPSARQVALASAYESVTSNWHAAIDDGASLALPPSWIISTATGFGCRSLISDQTGELLLVKPHIEPPPACPYLPTRAADAVHDAIDLYLTSHNPYAPRPTGRPIATLQHGTTTIAVYAEQYDPNALDLFVNRAGSNITHVLTLGLGRDGRVAGGVLASIRAVT